MTLPLESYINCINYINIRKNVVYSLETAKKFIRIKKWVYKLRINLGKSVDRLYSLYSKYRLYSLYTLYRLIKRISPKRNIPPQSETKNINHSPISGKPVGG